MLVGLVLPDSRTNVLIAAAIAHYNGGYFRQNEPPGQITVESEGQMRIERAQIAAALGRPCPDEDWQALAAQPRGRVAVHTSELIVIE